MSEHVCVLEPARVNQHVERAGPIRAEVQGARRTLWFRAAAGPVIAALAIVMAACGVATSHASPASTAPTTPVGWLRSVAEPWNHKLNTDQLRVLDDSKASGNESSSTYFNHLEGVCTQMLDDAQQAGQISRAPSASLDAVWRRMANATQAYASECVAVAKRPSQAALTRWNAKLSAMDSANGAFNVAVQAVHPAPTPSPTTPTTATG